MPWSRLPLAALELHFSEGVDLKFSGVSLTGPDQKAVATGDPTHFGNGEAYSPCLRLQPSSRHRANIRCNGMSLSRMAIKGQGQLFLRREA